MDIRDELRRKAKEKLRASAAAVLDNMTPEDIRHLVNELQVYQVELEMPQDVDFRQTDSLGLRLVTMFAEQQLGGTVELTRDAGTEFLIRFRPK